LCKCPPNFPKPAASSERFRLPSLPLGGNDLWKRAARAGDQAIGRPHCDERGPTRANRGATRKIPTTCGAKCSRAGCRLRAPMTIMPPRNHPFPQQSRPTKHPSGPRFPAQSRWLPDGFLIKAWQFSTPSSD